MKQKHLKAGHLSSEARERVLRVAEDLFSEHGYDAVTLRDIADKLGMRQASLYNHAPGGKEQLFVEVMERALTRHRLGMEEAISKAQTDIRSQLRAIAHWFLSQPSLNLNRSIYANMSSIAPEHAERLRILGYEQLHLPIVQLIETAEQHGEICRGTQLLAGIFLNSIEALRTLESYGYGTVSLEMRVEELLTLLLDGAKPR